MTEETKKDPLGKLVEQQTEREADHKRRMDKLAADHADRMAKHDARMKELDEETRKMDRMGRFMFIGIAVLAALAFGSLVFSAHGVTQSADDRDRWAHRFCRQTCRTLDYRPLMFSRVAYGWTAEEEQLDGLVCRCADDERDTIHYLDQDGDHTVQAGRDFAEREEASRDAWLPAR